MPRMISMMLVGWCLLCGCAKPSGVPGKAAEDGALLLKPIDAVSSVYLARRGDHISVTSGGILKYVLTTGKSYGPNDVPSGSERHEVRQGQLTREQMEEHAGEFDSWDDLSQAGYGGVADGPEIAIQYGDHKVFGGSLTPREVWEIFARLRELGSAMPVTRE